MFLGGEWVKLGGCGCSVGGVTSASSLFLKQLYTTQAFWKRMWASTSCIEQSAVRAHAVLLCFPPRMRVRVCACACARIHVLPFNPQVIYELTQGERQLIEDLSLLKKVLVHQNITFDLYYYLGTHSADLRFSHFHTPLLALLLLSPHLSSWSLCSQVYYEPMLKLDIMTESELGQIFGTLDSLIPLHQGKRSRCFDLSPIATCHNCVWRKVGQSGKYIFDFQRLKLYQRFCSTYCIWWVLSFKFSVFISSQIFWVVSSGWRDQRRPSDRWGLPWWTGWVSPWKPRTERRGEKGTNHIHSIVPVFTLLCSSLNPSSSSVCVHLCF